ncbi:hypothetical protein FGG08_006015 [Glutinoglossum americanum]|uniref:Uncharacterized protein n=1 Tax=Glutinoglossum americanum TaxID=1670608 RepID=A0A9P8L2D9_9PEZI|nr:hypothetical protein FGG08_006015 [Glutinoglossum americanum]
MVKHIPCRAVIFDVREVGQIRPPGLPHKSLEDRQKAVGGLAGNWTREASLRTDQEGLSR